MDSKVKYIFEQLEAAGVSVADFANVADISRVTLYKWKNGGNIKDMLRLRIAYRNATSLEKAVAKGRLPLTEKLTKQYRRTALKKLIWEMYSEV